MTVAGTRDSRAATSGQRAVGRRIVGVVVGKRNVVMMVVTGEIVVRCADVLKWMALT